jgi:hypothetical protein
VHDASGKPVACGDMTAHGASGQIGTDTAQRPSVVR